MPLTRYTPSLLPAEVLEALFVVRDRPLELLMERVRQAADSDIRNHSLIVGPRGAGKTHLLSLVAHRTTAMIAGGSRLRLCWLPEDPWVIVSYAALLRAVLTHAGKPTEPTVGEREAEARISQLADTDGPIVVIVENLDQILTQIGEAGQQRLRSLLQTQTDLLLVASTTRLDRSLMSASEPFFQFFTTTALEPFTVEEARTMLQTIARHRGDDELVRRLASDEATSRLRTVAHLAGGQPRLWSALADALTADGVRDLIDTLLTRFDDLTPYYQEQLARLSPHQRLTVAALASADHPVHVADIALATGIEQKSVSKTLSELRDAGWIRPTDSPFARLLDARRTYYELAEPLARLSFQLKETRGEPLRLIVDFLTAWFDPSDADRLDGGLYVTRMVEEFRGNPTGSIVRRLSGLPATRVPAVELLAKIDDALAALADGEPGPILALPTPLRVALEARVCSPDDPAAQALEMRGEIHSTALEEMGSVPHMLSVGWLKRAEELAEGLGAKGLLFVLRWQTQMWSFDAAEATLAALEMAGTDATTILLEQMRLSRAHQNAGHLGIARSFAEYALTTAEKLDRFDPVLLIHIRDRVASACAAEGDVARAIALFEESLADSERLLGSEHPDTLASRNNLAYAYESAGDLFRAIPLHEQTLSDLERLMGPDHIGAMHSRNNLACAYDAAGQPDRALPLLIKNASDRERILGADHPHTISSLMNLAYTYVSAGDLASAIPLHERVVSDAERVLGPEHPDTLTSRNNLAGAYSAAGLIQAALTVYEKNLSDSERVLGPEHPDTLLARNNFAHVCLSAGMLERAIPLLQQNASESERILGDQHPDVADRRAALLSALKERHVSQ